MRNESPGDAALNVAAEQLPHPRLTCDSPQRARGRGGV